MIQKILSLVTVSLIMTAAMAQNETDAYRYSNLSFGGTARYNGMGGAFGALGGDISCMVINPAGIARYTKSDFNFTVLYEGINSNTNFLSTNSSASKGNFNLGSVGFVGTKKLDDYKWRYMQFGFAYNRTNYFHNSIVMDGVNTSSSMADVFRSMANGYTGDDLVNYFPNTADLAYQAYIIDPADTMVGTTEYTDRIPLGVAVNQTRSITRRGNMSEFTFNFAGNYEDKLYVGGSFGIPGARFEEDWTHHEALIDPDDTTSLKDFTYSQTLTTRGVGFNAKLGIIFLPVDWVRLGAAIHTPNYLSFNDTWNNSMSSNFDDGDAYDITGPLNTYVWRLRTPPKYLGSIAVIILKKAAIDVDVEYVDYGKMRLRRDWSDQSGYDFSSENKVINQNFKGAINIRAGAEVKINPMYLRAGYSINQSPYVNGITKTDASVKTISGGLGYRKNGFSADLGVNFVTFGEDYYPYDPVLFNSQPAEITTNIVRTSVTFGWKF
jgi:hypothetical protein